MASHQHQATGRVLTKGDEEEEEPHSDGNFTTFHDAIEWKLAPDRSSCVCVRRKFSREDDDQPKQLDDDDFDAFI